MVLPLLGAGFAIGSVFTPVFGSSFGRILATPAKILGCSAAAMHLLHVASMLYSREQKTLSELSVWKDWIFARLPPTMTYLKNASAFKTSRMMKNALEVAEIEGPGVLSSHLGHRLFGFSNLEKETEECHGAVWVGTVLPNTNIYLEEGLWMSARLLAGAMTQTVAAVFVLLVGIGVTTRASSYDPDNAAESLGLPNEPIPDEQVDQVVASLLTTVVEYVADATNITAACTGISTNITLNQCNFTATPIDCPGVTQDELACAVLEQQPTDELLTLNVLNASGLDLEEMTAVVTESITNATDDALSALMPSDNYMVTIPMVVATLMAFLTAVWIASTSIPSAMATVLKLRSGVIPSMRDPNFQRYRKYVDEITVLTGSVFWGCLVGGLLTGSLFGLVVFFFVWQLTMLLAQQLFSYAVGE